MLLAVFSGIAMFGFWGIVIGPVLMIVIVTTISVYLAVFKGIPLDLPDDEHPKPKRRFWPFTRKSTSPPDQSKSPFQKARRGDSAFSRKEG